MASVRTLRGTHFVAVGFTSTHHMRATINFLEDVGWLERYDAKLKKFKTSKRFVSDRHGNVRQMTNVGFLTFFKNFENNIRSLQQNSKDL